MKHEKHRWIAESVPNKTFADIGGLWNTVNETVSVAMLHGASEATMIDYTMQDVCARHRGEIYQQVRLGEPVGSLEAG